MQLAVDKCETHDAGLTQQDVGPPSVPAPTPSGSRPTWCVVATYAQAERRADANLRQQGYETYLPLVLVRRRDRVLHTMWHNLEVPLFPAYLFVCLDPEHDPWRPILHTPGVFNLLTVAGKPHPCRAGDVEALQASEAIRRCPVADNPLDRPVGSSWRLSEGALRGMEVVILQNRGQRLRCALVLGTGLATIDVPTTSLAPRD